MLLSPIYLLCNVGIQQTSTKQHKHFNQGVRNVPNTITHTHSSSNPHTHTHKPLTRHFIYSKYYYLIENKVCADDPTDNFRFFITFSALAIPLSIAIIVIWSIYTHSKHFYHCLFTFCKRVRDEIFITSSNIVLRSVW